MSQSSELSTSVVPQMLTTEEAAALLGVTRRFLDKDRYIARQNGTPPTIPYIALGYRTIRYRRSDVLAFLAASRID